MVENRAPMHQAGFDCLRRPAKVHGLVSLAVVRSTQRRLGWIVLVGCEASFPIFRLRFWSGVQGVAVMVVAELLRVGAPPALIAAMLLLAWRETSTANRAASVAERAAAERQ